MPDPSVELLIPAPEGGGGYAALFALATRTGERVAALEVRHDALKNDTETIRAGIHDVKNEQQKYVHAEEECARQLRTIGGQVGHLVEVAPTIERAVQAFEGMQADLRLLSDRMKIRRSVWGGVVRTAAFVTATIAAAAGIVSVVASWPHISIHVG